MELIAFMGLNFKTEKTDLKSNKAMIAKVGT